ncbi:MAG: Tryptophan-rich sensory protein precursor, partial [uncultured Acetobacteraceae bacterium]
GRRRIGRSGDRDRAVVPGLAETVLAATRLALRPGLDGHLRVDRAGRLAGLAADAGHRRARPGARGLRSERFAQHILERAVLHGEAAGLGAGGGGGAVALHRAADRRVRPARPGGGLAVGALPRLGRVRRRAELERGPAQPALFRAL